MFTTEIFAVMMSALCLSTTVNSHEVSNDFYVHEKIVLNSVKMQELEKRLNDMELSHQADRTTLLNENTELSRELRNLKEQVLNDIELSRELRNLKEQVLNDIELLTPHQDTPAVAFSAYNPNPLSYGDGDTIVYQSTLMNTGSGYDTNTGIFTAPTSGLYLFTVHTCNAVASWAVVAIVHENTKLAISSVYSTGDDCGSVSALHNVAQGETVHVESAFGYTGMKTNQFRRNSFLGVLLHADRNDTSSQQVGPIA